MASSRRNPLYTNNNSINKDYPGCMGGLMHLFDFNQALAGRKLLTDKKSAAGVEAPRNSLDVGGSLPEAPKSNVEKNDEVMCGHELQRASAPRRLNGMPIKALIAQELSKESDSKNRAPSVVARLMGLDALPTDSKVSQKRSSGGKLGKIDEKFTQRSVVERQRHEEVTPHSVRLYAKKAKASVVSGQKSSVSLRSDSQDGKSGLESQTLCTHPQEQQLQEFKKEFEAWQSQKSRVHLKRSSRLDDTQAHVPSQQGFQHEKQFATKPRESFSSVKLNAPHDQLHESREFQDALEFLQSNKEFFMRFLHEPNSLFAKHLQDNESNSLSPPQAMEWMKQRRSHRAADANEGTRPESWATGSPVSKQYLKSDRRDDSRPPSWAKESPMSRSPKGDIMVERNILSIPHSPRICSEEALGLQGGYRHAFSPVAHENRIYSTHCHIPTRIVVLKPSPGKVRNLKVVSPVYCRSPKDQNSNDGFREDSMDVLERLREKLRKDGSGDHRRSDGLHIDEQQYRDVSKDPREIAREIARQVRENITRDLMIDPRCVGNLPSTAPDTNLGRRLMQATDSQDTSASDLKACGLAKRPYRDNYPKSASVLLHPDTAPALESLHASREGMVTALERVRTKSTRVSEGSMSPGLDFSSNHGICRKDSNGQFAVGQKNLRISTGSGRYHLDSLYLNESLHPSIRHKTTAPDQVEDPMRRDRVFDVDPFSGENKVSISATLRRSQSSDLAIPGDEIMADLQISGGDNAEDLASEVGSARVDHNMIVDVNSPTDINASSVELATKHVEDSGILGSGEANETIVRMEEHSGSHTREVVGAVNLNKLLPSSGECSGLDEESCASPCETCVVDSTSIESLSRQKHGTLLHSNDINVEVLVDLAGQEGETFHIAQNMEALYLNNDARAPLDSTTAKPRFLALPTSDSSADSVAEPARAQPEQPSPVSVQDLPFQEESLVAVEFKELSPDLEELRPHASLDKSGNGDNDKHNLDNFELVLDVSSHLKEEICVGEGGHTDNREIHEGEAPSTSFYKIEEMGEESEMCYVKNILAASGVAGDGSTALTWWSAPGQPLNPCLFQKMERSSIDQEKDNGDNNEAALKPNKQGKERSDILRRRLLFDSANEVLLTVLGPHVNSCLRVNLPKPALRVPTGQDLVNLVWSCVWCSLCSHTGPQETLENLVTKDLGKGGDWLDVGVEIEATGLAVERAILDDLIEETLLVL